MNFTIFIWLMIRLTCAFIFIFSFFKVSGQDMLGTALGNYAGANSLQLNPSALLNSKQYLDIQLTGVGVFFENNAIYLPKEEYRFVHFFQKDYEWPAHKQQYGTGERYFYLYDNTRNKNVFNSLRVNGPGAMLVWKNHAIAIHTSLRSVFSLRKIPYEIASFSYYGLNYKPLQNQSYSDHGPFGGTAMVWGEIGLAYAHTLYAHGFNKLSAGINIKWLFGVGGTYIDVDNIDYTVLNDSTVNIHNMDARMGFSLPVDYSTNDLDFAKKIKGTGFSGDIGITYTRLSPYHRDQYFTSLCSRRHEPYRYRVGVALIDFGAIRFNINALKLSVDNRASYWDHLTRFDYESINQVLDTLSMKFYNDTTSLFVGTDFLLWLPGAITAQFDYHFGEHWYLNTNIVVGLKMGRQTMVRPSEISITPRYESAWFEAGVPVSLYDFISPRIGLYLRFFGFTVGTDNIAGFFYYKDFSGLDLYCSVKYFIRSGKCRRDKVPLHCIEEKRDNR